MCKEEEEEGAFVVWGAEEEEEGVVGGKAVTGRGRGEATWDEAGEAMLEVGDCGCGDKTSDGTRFSMVFIASSLVGRSVSSTTVDKSKSMMGCIRSATWYRLASSLARSNGILQQSC